MPPSSPSVPPSFQHNFQIIVHPPEEEDQPDYLVFDALHVPDPNLDLATPPDFVSLDDALARLHSEEYAPEFNRTGVESVVMPRRCDPRPEPDPADETVRDDSEIVEVVKFRRTFPQEQEDPPPKTKPKPRSLRSRAGSAFRSIKNLARVASRSTSNSSASSSSASNRPYAQDVFATSSSTQATFATTPIPDTSEPLTRRGSVILTNLFRTPSRADSPTSSFDLPPAERYSDDVEDERDGEEEDRESIMPRAPSPSPSAASFTTGIRRRLSILNFPRKSRTTPRSPPSSPPRPSSPPTLSRGSTVPSTSSSSAPPTPTDETFPPPPPSLKDADDDPDRTIGEMRLDSLHFEALSFDADQF